MTAPMTPARSPVTAPSLCVIGVGEFCCNRYVASTPPLMIHRQQHRFPAEMMGSAESTPITRPPMSAGCVLLVVVFTAEMGDELFALQIPQLVLQLYQLNEEIVLRVQLRRVHRALEVERQPFLHARHAGALREIHEQRDVEDDRRREDAVSAEEIDLELHRIAEPAEQIDVVPAFLVVAARR